jgi:hypothetical protein
MEKGNGDEMKYQNIIILGAGSNFGSEYKIGLFKKLRPLAVNIFLVEMEDNDLAPIILEAKLVDFFISIKNFSTQVALKDIITQLEKNNFTMNAVVTYREEWLYLRVLLAQYLNLPHPSLEAVTNSQDKYLARRVIEKSGIKQIKFEICTFEDLSTKIFEFPLFVKPSKGIRSEFARLIKNKEALNIYVENCREHKALHSLGFIIEEALEGHEVDVDIVMFNGELLYSEVSDNFPVYTPFALETGHLMPSIIDESYQKALVKLAFESAKACGYDRGVLHIEMMLKSNGQLAVIEINGRLGGMYIALWHELVWGVDLIKAELAISAGMNPKCFLEKFNSCKMALAQVCVTTNCDNEFFLNEKSLVIEDWINFQSFRDNKDVYKAEKWIDLPNEKEININGHVNIGEVTVKDENPLLAFKKLSSLLEENPLEIQTNKGLIKSSTKILRKFCSKTPKIKRFQIEKFNGDTKDIETLLSFITTDITKLDRPIQIPDATCIFLAFDIFSQDSKRPIGIISIHVWERLRNQFKKSGYIHDLVVHPSYRKLSIAKMLIEKTLELENIGKYELACESGLVELYKPLGFKTVGMHLAKYIREEVSLKPQKCFAFLKTELDHKGEWLFGQDLVVQHLFNIHNDKRVIIPKHFFLPKNDDPAFFVNDVYSFGKAFSVKYSLNGEKSFSYDGIRGANSSRGRRLDIEFCSKQDLLQRIREFIEKSPQNCSGLVLQEFIDQKGGCLCHGEFSRNSFEVELLWEACVCRAYFHESCLPLNEEKEKFEEIKGCTNCFPTNRLEACKQITEMFFKKFSQKLFESYGDMNWSLEGFWSPADSQLTILQLRPTPGDRPFTALRFTQKALFETYFSWGDYEIGPLELTEETLENFEGIYMRKSSSNEQIETRVLDQLTNGNSLLLIDPFRGFCLSHEKWFLPIPVLRKKFSFIHIPKNVISSNRGRFVRILSSGRRGYIVPVF